MIRKFLSVAFPLFFLFLNLPAQSNDRPYPVYLIGNTANRSISPSNYQLLKQELDRQPGHFTVVHLGDIITKEGWPENPYPQHAQKMQQLLDLVKENPKGKLIFLPGDRDWGNSKKDGLAAVRRLEKYISARMPHKNAFVPGNGCPGPEVLDVAPNLRIIALNTQWWMHPFRKPELPDTDCKNLSKEEFLEELEENISEAGNRNVLLVGHHPVVSEGYYGGKIPAKKHLFPLLDMNPDLYVPLPVLGSIYAAYRQNVGTPRDMANFRYADFREKMFRIFRLNPGTIYASAHDYNLQLNYQDRTYHLVSGSTAQKQPVDEGEQTLFSASVLGFTKLEYFPNGEVASHFYAFSAIGLEHLKSRMLFSSPCLSGDTTAIPQNRFFRPCPPESTIPSTPDPNVLSGLTTVVAGPQYAAKPTKKFFLGKLYRSTWTQPVQVLFLDLRKTYGGLKPEGTGGGRQTVSLKFSAKDGSQYVFRSVDKDPVKALPLSLRETFLTQVLRDIMATGHPYGASIVASLLDSTDILHARPRLFVLPNDSLLGPYRGEFAGLLGYLEERPTDPAKGVKSFKGVHHVPRTVRLFRTLYDDHHNRLDAYAFGKARAFDIWIGDFGRHEDNWRWAGFKQGGQVIYKPIPRDRDHAFSKWDGVFPWLADKPFGVKTIQNFGADFSGLPSLTYQARYLDRALLTPLSRQDWQQIAKELQKTMTEATIEKAVTSVPAEVAPITGPEISRKLKSRLKRLPKALDRFYLDLAQVVDILGSNKEEYFRVERQPGGKVRVQQFAKDKVANGPAGPALFDRTFFPKETREIRIFALDGADEVEITGHSQSSILVRVIGGAGTDKVSDNSSVPGPKHYTRVYDTPGTQIQAGPETKDLTSDHPDINSYSRHEYRENYISPVPGLLYNRSDGLGASLTVNFVRYVFREPGPKRIYSLGVAGTNRGAFLLKGSGLWNNVFGRWGVGGALTYGSYFPFYNFFGLGNNTSKDRDLFRGRTYYLARYKGLRAEGFTQTRFLQKSYFRFGPLFESLYSTTQDGTILDEQNTQQLVLGQEDLLGAQLELDFDLRDKEAFTRRGLRFQVKHETTHRLNGLKNTFGLTRGSAQYFGTSRIGIPITLALKLGGAKNYGQNLPFYKYTSLGLNDNLRGYVNNRFSGDRSAYVNSELRFHLGRNQNHILPFYYGLIYFYDQGRVWYRNNSPSGWHRGYGGGFYIAPVEERYALTLLLGHSREENVLVQFSLGLVLDK